MQLGPSLCNSLGASLRNSDITSWPCPMQLAPSLYNCLGASLRNTGITSWLCPMQLELSLHGVYNFMACLMQLGPSLCNYLGVSLRNSGITSWPCPKQLGLLLYNSLGASLRNSGITSWPCPTRVWRSFTRCALYIDLYSSGETQPVIWPQAGECKKNFNQSMVLPYAAGSFVINYFMPLTNSAENLKLLRLWLHKIISVKTGKQMLVILAR